MGIILKDWYGKDKVYEHEDIWVRGTDGGLTQFSKGPKATLGTLEVSENGVYEAKNVTGYDRVIVEVAPAVNETLIFPTDFAVFTANDNFDGLYAKTLTFETDIEKLKIYPGAEYTVSWDGTLYSLKAKDTKRIFEEMDKGESLIWSMYYLGNGSLLGYDDLADTGEPFVILYTASKNLTLISTDTVGSHNVAIMKRVRPQDGLDMMLQSITVEENGEYVADPFYDGISKVVVNVDPTKVSIMKETTLDASVLNNTFGYVVSINPTPFTLTLGQKYFVNWDGTIYECVAYDGSGAIPETIYIGNASALGLTGNGEPFIVAITPDDGGTCNFICGTDTEPTVHTVNIWQKISTPSDDVRYVTFMNWDGTVEYGKKAVAVGDDCANPVARGIFGTPTRESDVQNDYTHNGWSDEIGGSADSTWNKSITEDKVVYASFKSTTRSYTITYCDEDGTTMLKTESLPYGTMPSYEPTHPTDDTLMFDCWTPELETVTGDATYTVKWKQKATFSTASWDEIAEICNDGRASTTFALGDTKDVVLTYDDGTTETVTFEIVDMNLTSTKFYGISSSQYGNVALLATHTLKDPQKYFLTNPGSTDSVLFGYSNGEMTNVLKKLSNCLPEDAYNAIKTVTVGSIYTNDVKFVLPSTGNIFGKRWHRNGTSSYPNVPAQQLEIFANGRTKISKDASGNAVKYWTSSCEQTTTSGANRPIYVNTNGEMYKESSAQAYYVRLLCFI